MADRGGIEEDRRPNGKVRYRLVFYERGQRIRIYGRPNPVPGLPPAPFADRADAERVLDQIRADAAARDWPISRVLALWRPQAAPHDLVAVHVRDYLARYREMVRLGKRSPNSLREIERYASQGGHWGWWWERSVHGVSYGDVEEWHLWLAARLADRTTRPISAKTQKNVSDAFRAFLRWLHRRNVIESVPPFPPIEVPDHAPQVLDLDQLEAVLEAIPWERRGAFLAAAYEALRVGEVRAADLDDYRNGRMRVARAVQGPRLEAPIRHTKNRSAEWREVWHPELRRWLEWRLLQARPERRLRGEVALFWNPTAQNTAKRWTPDPLEREWARACAKVGVRISLQEGTRHTILTAAGAALPERLLRAFSRHRDGKSLGRYSQPKATRAAMVQALHHPQRTPSPDSGRKS